MKRIYTFFCLFLLALPIKSWGEELTLDCKYDHTVYLSKPANNAKQDDGYENLTLRINFDSGLLVQDSIEDIPFTIEGDILSYRLWGDTDKKNWDHYLYRLNAVNGRLQLENRGGVADTYNWWNVDSNGYAALTYVYYDCIKVGNLF